MIQVIILVLGCVSIWLVGSRESWSRWGYITGLCSQPFWLFSTYQAEQWGMFVLSIWYVFAWARGIWNHWIFPTKTYYIPERGRL